MHVPGDHLRQGHVMNQKAIANRFIARDAVGVPETLQGPTPAA